jgi:hypothetical protein
MGSFTLTIIDPEKGKNNANGLKLLTFILYYVYYNTNSKNSEVNFGNIEQGERNVAFIDYENITAVPNDTSTGYYMRFGHLLNFLDNYVIPKSGKSNKIVKIAYGISKMYRHPCQYSADPRVCLVAVPSKEPINSKLILVRDTTGDFEEEVQWKIPNQGWVANSMNIYVSHPQILKSLEANLDDKGNLSIFNFLKDICTALNVALGGLNNLEPVIDESDNTLHIIDASYHTQPKGHGYEFELYGYNKLNKINPNVISSNFVRSFNLKTEITPEFATMASIGATAAGYVKGTENTMFSRWNMSQGLTDRFQEEYHAPTSNTAQEARNDVLDLYKSRIWLGMLKAFGYTTGAGGKIQLDDNVINSNLSMITEFFKYVQSELKERKKDYASTQSGFIPISLGITMDGISGMKIYNSINVSTRFLPDKYPENLVFIIKGVNHKLSNSDWETTIETVVVSKVNK